MSDLISRSALIAEYDRQHEGEPGKARKLIADAPTVDAVPVVRCKECVNRHKSHACPMCYDEYFDIYDEYGYFDSDHTTHDFTEDDGFCNRGERRSHD